MDYSFGSVVFRKDAVVEYLLVHHAGPGHWDFPKGHPDDDEKPEQTAAREVLEETNKTDGEAFLAANAEKEGVVTTESGVQYEVLTLGEGETKTQDLRIGGP